VEGARGLAMLLTWIVTVGGELEGAAGVQVTMSRVSWRTPSCFLNAVRPLIVDIDWLFGGVWRWMKEATQTAPRELVRGCRVSGIHAHEKSHGKHVGSRQL
jgi:hypothetical protein